jgi:hypothetical protein
MDQGTLVSINLAGGWRLIDALEQRGFPITAAFWAKLDEYEKWILYIASPVVDERGRQAAYLAVHEAMGDDPVWEAMPFRVSVLSEQDPMAKVAADAVKPKVAAGSSTAAKPYHGMTRYDERSLGGHYHDGVFIYPPWEPGLNPVG